jgi:hypothetical protein
MTIDLVISLSLGLDKKTGVPYVYYNGKIKFAQFSDFIIPEKYRKYLHQRNNVFHYYIEQFSNKIFMMSVEEFLDNYPIWENIKNYILNNENYCWSEKDHYEFKEFLSWANEKYYYIISWSY